MAHQWRIYRYRDDRIDDLARQIDLPPVLTASLVRRGLIDRPRIESFLDPSLARLPDPGLLPDMDAAVDRLARAAAGDEHVVIYGDYDADGVTATVLLTDFLRRCGVRTTPYIPHRLDEGYGLNPEAVRWLKDQGADLIVTVDCGVSDREAVMEAGRLGLDVIVTDHHQTPPELPPAVAVVNPQRPDHDFPQAGLAGVGVAFFLAGGLRRALRESGVWTKTHQPELAGYLALAAIGTVADVSPLTGVNRILVAEGLKQLTRSGRPGLVALKESSALAGNQPVTVRDVAFRLAPRLNAAGRLGSARSSLELLLTPDADQAARLAADLEEINKERRRLQERVYQDAARMIEESGVTRKAIVLAKAGWPRGVVGLAASRLAEQFGLPAVLMEVDGGLARGSARSARGFNLFGALNKLRDLMIRFGGHEQAAGLTLAEDMVPRLAEALAELAAEEIDDDVPDVLDVDGVVSLEALEAMRPHLPRLEPHGAGNPEPVLAVADLKVLSAGVVGRDHLKLTLGDGVRAVSAIGFGLGGRLPELGPRTCAALAPHMSTYRGQTTLGFKILDLKKEIKTEN